MSKPIWLIAGLVGALGGAMVSGLAIAQDAPESLLPPGFDDPEPAPAPAPSQQQPAPPPTAAPPVAPGVAPPAPNVGSQSGPAPSALPAIPQISSADLAGLPTEAELEKLTDEELDDLLGLKPQFDIPPAARRSLSQVGILSTDEGGLPVGSLSSQPQSLVRATLAGTGTPLVSRWGHILVRRALASRLSAPEGMNPVEFAALRVGVLNRMGEYSAARGLVQDVDTGNWSESLAEQALTAFIALSDPVGACPYVRFQGIPESEEKARWELMSAICNSYAGESARAGAQLDKALEDNIAADIDVLLARRFAGAAGSGQRAVSIEWEGVDGLNPWRFALANAVGEPLPEPLLAAADGYYARSGAMAAMLPLGQRAQYASRAGEEGILSSQALVDLYSAIYADPQVGGAAGERARNLRASYVAPDDDARISAMEALWNEESAGDRYWAKVLTAYAAARILPFREVGDTADDLITSMLTAGLDRDALAWRSVVDNGSLAWALIAIVDPEGGVAETEGLASFVDNDSSEEQRRSQFLIAALAGLSRISGADRDTLSDELSLALDGRSKWTRMIDRAAEVGNPAMVALLAGLGMQGNDWSQMTPLHLYHVVSALNRVGLSAEARMIAAEAVSRG